MRLAARSLDQPTLLHVVGVGASAGGLEAMLPMFAHMRPTGRLAYVVAQHMAHDGHSELVARLIGRESALPVLLAREVEQLRADTVYVIPAGKDGTVQGTTLILHEPAATNLSTPSVNVLFSSIAASGHHNAIGIVLSGTGADGVAGCRALKAKGGLTVAQDPAEAKFDGMPDAAIQACVIDQVLPVATIGDVLAARFSDGAPAAPKMPPSGAAVSLPPDDAPVSETAHRELLRLLPMIHEATSIDFSSYKEDTLLRRLEKRKATVGMEDADRYLAHVKRQPDELKTLQHLFLVSVSSFFRDRASFRELEHALVGRLAAKPAGEPVRVWVPGCASGEEPYTLALLLAELLGEHRRNVPVRIIGTDLNPEALEMARAALYRQTAFKEMDANLRDRYFTAKGQHFEVLPVLREMVEFERRDVLTGPPPGLGDSIDLVSCRNLLIYMKSPLQDQLITSFHRVLASQGLLFIGQSESLSFVGNSLFAPIDHYHRLFRRRH